MTKEHSQQIHKMNAGSRHRLDQLCWSNIQIYLHIPNKLNIK